MLAVSRLRYLCLVIQLSLARRQRKKETICFVGPGEDPEIALLTNSTLGELIMTLDVYTARQHQACTQVANSTIYKPQSSGVRMKRKTRPWRLRVFTDNHYRTQRLGNGYMRKPPHSVTSSNLKSPHHGRPPLTFDLRRALDFEQAFPTSPHYGAAQGPHVPGDVSACAGRPRRRATMPELM